MRFLNCKGKPIAVVRTEGFPCPVCVACLAFAVKVPSPFRTTFEYGQQALDTIAALEARMRSGGRPS